MGQRLWEGDADSVCRVRVSSNRERGDLCRSSRLSPIGRTQRAKKWFAHSSTPIALSTTSLVGHCHWTSTGTRSSIPVLANRLPPQSIFTTLTSRCVPWTGALLTRPVDAVDAHDFQFGRPVRKVRGSTGVAGDRLLRGIERACLCRNVR